MTPANTARLKGPLLAVAGSAALLVAVFVFQYLGYAPCELCVLQRWPHFVAVILGLGLWVAAARAPRALPALIALGVVTMLISTGLGAFHAGVEATLWAGPSACTGGLGDMTTLSSAELLAQIRQAEVIRCDQPAWIFLGLSMAAWNAIASLVLALIWIKGLRRA